MLNCTYLRIKYFEYCSKIANKKIKTAFLTSHNICIDFGTNFLSNII